MVKRRKSRGFILSTPISTQRAPASALQQKTHIGCPRNRHVSKRTFRATDIAAPPQERPVIVETETHLARSVRRPTRCLRV